MVFLQNTLKEIGDVYQRSYYYFKFRFYEDVERCKSIFAEDIPYIRVPFVNDKTRANAKHVAEPLSSTSC